MALKNFNFNEKTYTKSLMKKLIVKYYTTFDLKLNYLVT